MNPWRYRLATGLLFWLAMRAHSEVTTVLPNTPEGMFLFHISAALVDFILLVSVANLVSGRLCDDLETLCLVSMVVNFAGFVAYLAYAPPVFYNTIMWGLAYVQWGRLLLADRYDSNDLGQRLVRRFDSRRA